MNPEKRINQLLNGLSKLYDRNKLDDVTITENEIEFKTRATDKSNIFTHSFFILLIFLPPILLVIYGESKWSGVLALIWALLFSYQFFQIVRYINKVEIQISHNFISVLNEDLIGKFLFKEKRIDFNQIKEIKTEPHRVTRYGSGYTGVFLLTNEEEKHRLITFEDKWVAEKTKNVLNMIIELKNIITEPNRVARRR